jgi:glycosyltransferase involved in cell wall biosynthesis
MKISVVTISYNQAQFLKSCIDSVLNQSYGNFEYIVVDPGSSDGSRDIINSYGDKIKRIYEKDEGPADGLNSGFSVATGEIFYYLNSDDVVLPGAFDRIVELFNKYNNIDVLYGNAYVTNESGAIVRKCYSDNFSLQGVAYGSSVVIQPSTFIKKHIFKKVNGFNIKNKSNWDGELLIDMAIAGAGFKKVDDFFSEYRVHGMGITGSGRLADQHRVYAKNMFKKIKNREQNAYDEYIQYIYRFYKHVRNPSALIERLKKGPIFSSTTES